MTAVTPIQLTDESRPQRYPIYMLQQSGKKSVILNNVTKRSYATTPFIASIWLLCSGKNTIAQITQKLINQYPKIQTSHVIRGLRKLYAAKRGQLSTLSAERSRT